MNTYLHSIKAKIVDGQLRLPEGVAVTGEEDVIITFLNAETEAANSQAVEPAAGAQASSSPHQAPAEPSEPSPAPALSDEEARQWWAGLNEEWQQVLRVNRELSQASLSEAQQTKLTAFQNPADTYAELFGKTFLAEEAPPIGEIREILQLERLYCQKTQVESLEPLQALRNLKMLFCSWSRISSFQPLRQHKQLETLYANFTRLGDLETLSSLPNLKTLVVGQTRISDLSPLQSLTQLEDLRFADTEVDNLNVLSPLKHLRSLFLSGTQVADLEPIKSLPSIEILDLADTPVHDLAPLANMQYLKKLWLSNTPVASLSPIMRLPLEQLDCRYTNVSPGEVDNFRLSHPETEVFPSN